MFLTTASFFLESATGWGSGKMLSVVTLIMSNCSASVSLGANLLGEGFRKGTVQRISHVHPHTLHIATPYT